MKFLEVLKQLHINIPLVEALEQMPNNVKVHNNALKHTKLKDPKSFTILCSIGNQYHKSNALSVFKKLGIGKTRARTLADRSYGHSEGKIEDVSVRVDKFIFPVDFIILECEADKEVPIILGRPFLATGRTLIDVQKGELTMQFNDQ
ncbi:hypothetical protein EPI10_001734 [Gossypium australe]|uniref:Retrovirus-related Pol polyprotein from transposon opus n=1 Tax=Gossypium australe TaxID=47621 RepID=A0A5B6VBS9_9ROSI|nr:hypothetical protein EPI10_001734 [Gossypium australe]